MIKNILSFCSCYYFYTNRITILSEILNYLLDDRVDPSGFYSSHDCAAHLTVVGWRRVAEGHTYD